MCVMGADGAIIIGALFCFFAYVDGSTGGVASSEAAKGSDTESSSPNAEGCYKVIGELCIW
jgi:hypothetical protein